MAADPSGAPEERKNLSRRTFLTTAAGAASAAALAGKLEGAETLSQPTAGAPAFAASPSAAKIVGPDRKSTRLNSSHVKMSYAVFCLKKKKKKQKKEKENNTTIHSNH